MIVHTLIDRLGLSDDELCTVLDADPLSLISGAVEHQPELPILLALTEEVEEAVGQATLRRWVRTSGPTGTPIEHLLARDFAAFEDDLAALRERGFSVVSSSARGDARRARRP